MATKKPATTPTTSTAVAVKKTGTNLVSVKDQLADQLAALAGKTAPVSGNAIRITQDKQFRLPDGTSTPGPLQLVVVDFVSKNMFYEGVYDPNATVPPACFAIASSPLNMVPSDNAPVKQAASCSVCSMNQFGSAGNGKACKNGRVLAVLPPDADDQSPIWTLAVSPTALKAWDGYVNSVVRTFSAPPVGVITEVSFDPGSTYPSLRFGNPVLNENVAEHLSRVEEANALIAVEPDVSQYGVESAPRGRAPARPAARAPARPAARR